MRNNLAILGAGKLGVTLAQLAVNAGYCVTIAGSGNPAQIELSMRVLVPGANIAHPKDAATIGDMVILALPLSKYRTIPREALSGKLVVDSMNYWWEVDGDEVTLLADHSSSSEMIQSFLPNSRVVKALSHMGYHHLTDEALPRNADDRKAIAIASDHQSDIVTVSRLVDDLGFDPVPIGNLAAGKVLEPGHPAFGAHTNAKLLREIVSQSS